MNTHLVIKSMITLIPMVFGLIFDVPHSYAQKKALNIAGIHQLVSESKSEYDRQNNTRNNQGVTTANEQVNKTMLAKLKNKYRELQQRFQTLGTLIDAANIGIYAGPLVNRIVQNQMEIYHIAQQDPLFIAMAYQSERNFVDKSGSLLNYLVGLCASIGAVNQMKASDRKILFDHILIELSNIQELSAKLVSAMQISQMSGMIRNLNPFQNYIDQDRQIINEIFRNTRFLGLN